MAQLPLPAARFAQEAPVRNVDLLVIGVGQDDLRDGRIESAWLTSLGDTLGGVVQQLVSFGDFEGKWFQTSVSLCPVPERAKRVLLLGIGKSVAELPNLARELGLRLAEEAIRHKARRVGIVGMSPLLSTRTGREQVALGFHVGRFPGVKMQTTPMKSSEEVRELVFEGSTADGEVNWKRVDALGSAVDFCRTLQDLPPNIATPEFISEEALREAKKRGLTTRVLAEDELRALGMNALLAVASGSVNRPRLVAVEYTPNTFKRSLALVGKGVTFDTGGYSLKPGDKMAGMKYDMSGSAVALSSLFAIADLKLPVRVVAVVALVENMVDGRSYRVDDVITTHSGKTIEIINTDAEGRVILSDALSFTATEFKPDRMVEFSTLTGGIVVALGKYGAGMFTFNDDNFGVSIQRAAEVTGERVWPMPTWEEIFDDIKGTIADVNNLGATTQCASSACGAMFLREFVHGLPFAHIDIAGVAHDNRIKGYPRKSGTGFGVLLAVELARALSEEK